MEPLRIHTGTVYPLNRTNVDTDQIIPKQFLKRIERQGFGQFLFYNWRFDDEGNERKDFSLNDPKYKNVSILVSGDNFGCGSSREHAPWAIQDFGFKVIIAPGFADIFKNNCIKTGILPLQLKEEQVQEIMKKAQSESYHMTINLEEQTASDENGLNYSFEIAPYSKEILINGWDEIGVTLTYDDKIVLYENTRLSS
ncbi:3-isopropylmalate dehydratase small subunit [Heyndrickxia acidicola]|uniref:3-isopropylmalate dehydratase small subunit n=1 Tax=Heyndrickxia acidicola TaxID=209389 RepID=A0ABU6MC91_9BACI|nr:3-isopropylmalate dehydratase small subunit [Heyndrickxia acidicola]MED1202286.1 3-isopropylmalate dehydratase small subunit [Heyndrickxia acidicola]